MYQAYKDRVHFVFVYIHEAHPDDGWQLDDNRKERVIFQQPKSYAERTELAAKCSTRLKLSMPCAVDTMDNAVDKLYAAWPERMFAIEKGGKIAYAGKQGPWGFKPEEVAEWLKKYIGPPQGASKGD